VIESNCFGIPRARDRTDRRSPEQGQVFRRGNPPTNFGGTRNGSPAPPMQLPSIGGDEMLVKRLESGYTKTAANHADHPSSGHWLRRDQRTLHCAPRPLAAPPPPGPWSLRCIPLALVTDGLDDMRFRLGFGCATLHCGHRCAMRSAPALRSAPARRRPDRSAQTKSSR